MNLFLPSKLINITIWNIIKKSFDELPKILVVLYSYVNVDQRVFSWEAHPPRCAINAHFQGIKYPPRFLGKLQVGEGRYFLVGEWSLLLGYNNNNTTNTTTISIWLYIYIYIPESNNVVYPIINLRFGDGLRHPFIQTLEIATGWASGAANGWDPLILRQSKWLGTRRHIPTSAIFILPVNFLGRKWRAVGLPKKATPPSMELDGMTQRKYGAATNHGDIMGQSCTKNGRYQPWIDQPWLHEGLPLKHNGTPPLRHPWGLFLLGWLCKTPWQTIRINFDLGSVPQNSIGQNWKSEQGGAPPSFVFVGCSSHWG